MHEISHLRGFSETEARMWQQQFEVSNQLGHTILVYNEAYKTLHEGLIKISKGLHDGLFYLLNRNTEYNQYACDSILSAYEHGEKLLSGQSAVPALLRKKLLEGYQLLMPLRFKCPSLNTNDKEIAVNMTEALKNLDEITDLLRTYESRFCLEYNCREDVDDTHTPKGPLLLWSSFKDLYLHDVPYNELYLEKVKCELLNVKDKTSQTLKFNFENYPEGYSIGSARMKSPNSDKYIAVHISFQGIGVAPIYSKNTVMIEVVYFGNEKITSSKNFVVAGFGLLGVLDKNSLSKAEVQFAFTDSPMDMYNYYYETQKSAPVFSNEYKLKCDVGLQ